MNKLFSLLCIVIMSISVQIKYELKLVDYFILIPIIMILMYICYILDDIYIKEIKINE